MRKIFADLTPLREGTFRRFWLSGMLSSVGTQMSNFAVILQAYRLTHSSLAVGGVGLAAALPAIGLGLFGGVLIDAYDRRRLVLVTSAAMMLTSLLFIAQAADGLRSLWLLYLLMAIQSAATAVDNPARTTVTVRLLAGEALQPGMALVSLAMRASFIFGPAVAGVVTAASSLTVCYVIDAASFALSIYGVIRLPMMSPLMGLPSPRLGGVLAGLSIVRSSRVLTGALLADLNATFLAMPVALFPAINTARYGGSSRTLGLMTSALAVGGVLASTFSGPLARVRSQGKGMLLGGTVWAVAIAGFGLATSLPLALAFLVLAGAGDVASVVMRTTIVQLATPEAYLGRVNATDYAVGSGVPQLGNFRAGIVASITSPSASATGGGVASLIGTVLIAIGLPALVRYRGHRATYGKSSPESSERTD